MAECPDIVEIREQMANLFRKTNGGFSSVRMKLSTVAEKLIAQYPTACANRIHALVFQVVFDAIDNDNPPPFLHGAFFTGTISWI